MERRVIDQLEINTRLWERQASEATNPARRKLLSQRAERGRELEDFLKMEAANQLAT